MSSWWHTNLEPEVQIRPLHCPRLWTHPGPRFVTARDAAGKQLPSSQVGWEALEKAAGFCFAPEGGRARADGSAGKGFRSEGFPSAGASCGRWHGRCEGCRFDRETFQLGKSSTLPG